MIVAVDLTKYYGRTRGVEGLNFRVEAGEVVGFLGPNAAGKTTTMRLITGYMPPTRGSVRVCGYDALEEDLEAKGCLGYLPEHPPLYPDMTVKAYLEFVAEIKGLRGSARRSALEKVVESVGLAPVWGRLCANISRGFRQRVGLAQALLGDPPVLILDEPTSGLDPRQIIEVRRLIKSLAGKHTVIISSHILPEVSMVCTRVMIMDRGHVVAVDKPEELARRLTGSRDITLKVKGDRSVARRVLESIPGVSEVLDGPEGRLVVRSQREVDVREEIFRSLARADLPLLEMVPRDLTLEDVFLRLTTDEEGVEAHA